MTRSIWSGLLAALMLAGGCSAGAADAVRLVENADRNLAGTAAGDSGIGGLEFPSVRADMKAQYDEALRIAETAALSDEQRRYVLSHAHFGLAMARLFDLFDRVMVIFEEGGVSAALRGDETSGQRPPYCALFDDFDALQSIVELLLETSLDPIIDDLRATVAADPEFEMVILRARMDLSPLTSEPGANYFEWAATWGASDVRLLAGVAELLAGTLRVSFAWEDLFANLFLFSFVAAEPTFNQPAKLFNMNFCADDATSGNPLLNPEFGILRADGRSRLDAAAALLGEGLQDLAVAFANPAEADPERHLVGAAGAGRAWGTGIVETPEGGDRFNLVVSRNVQTPMQGVEQLMSNVIGVFFSSASALIDIDDFAAAISDVATAVRGRSRWDVRTSFERIVPGTGLRGLIESWTGISGAGAALPELDDFELPVIDFGVLFSSPPGDIRDVLPLYYLGDEPFTDANGDGVRNVESGIAIATSEEDYDNTEPYQRFNCNGRWDQRGDLIIQHEYEPFEDQNGDGTFSAGESGPQGTNASALGIVGAFVDEDADGVPDRGLVDGFAAAKPVQSSLCVGAAPVTWPGSEADPDFGRFALTLSEDTVLPYGRLVTQATISSAPYNDGSALGPVIGHYWPPRTFDYSGWPAAANRDAANGRTDKNYYFFQDPTLGGWFIRSKDGVAAPSASSNAWINRVLADVTALSDALGL
ncbi:MAG: hypothetical protein D6761_08850 [Candidatus Dadabacteria bacterium]|nr:MAG: hypothetical protein D6761_08850 [Candidatus Dadabacteria bacterium]